VKVPFDAVRLRPDASRCFKKVEKAEATIWKLLRVAEKSWRALNAPHLKKDVCEGKRLKDGVAVCTRIEPTRKAARLFSRTLLITPRSHAWVPL
jgi:hypothetical protein